VNTDIPLVEHLAALRVADQKFSDERDRRYSEVKLAEEKALAIKSTSDDKALLLARDIQDLKDEKANNLREQINSERGQYATKDDLANAGREVAATLTPIKDFVSGAAGRAGAAAETRLDKTQSLTTMQVAIMALALMVSVITVTLLVLHG
jgi:vacuolar-type H+-ATPase subunit H